MIVPPNDTFYGDCTVYLADGNTMKVCRAFSHMNCLCYWANGTTGFTDFAHITKIDYDVNVKYVPKD